MIKINKRKFIDGWCPYKEMSTKQKYSYYTIYVVVKDSKRIDSFLHYKNAQRKVRELKGG